MICSNCICWAHHRGKFTQTSQWNIKTSPYGRTYPCIKIPLWERQREYLSMIFWSKIWFDASALRAHWLLRRGKPCCRASFTILISTHNKSLDARFTNRRILQAYFGTLVWGYFHLLCIAPWVSLVMGSIAQPITCLSDEIGWGCLTLLYWTI